MAQAVILTCLLVIVFSLAETNAAPQFGGGSFASSQAGSYGGGGFGYPGQYPGFGYQRPGGFGYPGGHFGGGGLSRLLAYAAARSGGGYPGQYGGYPGQYGGYPGQYGGYPGQYGGQPGFGGPGFGSPGFGSPYSPGLSLSKSVSIGAGGISGSFAASAGK